MLCLRTIAVDRETYKLFEFARKRGMTDKDLETSIISVLDTSQHQPKDPLFQAKEKQLHAKPR